MSSESTSPIAMITPEAFLEHWQGHRRVTRRVIEAFPEDQLFSFSVGGMRSFGQLALEMLTMSEPMVRGVVTGEWDSWTNRDPIPKSEILQSWDKTTEQINALWPQIPAERFQETITAFGMFTDVTRNLLLYVVDNEIHHRGQGYAYLRALGIEPPPFYERN